MMMKELVTMRVYNNYNGNCIFTKEIPVSLIPNENDHVVITEEGILKRVCKRIFVYEPLNSIQIYVE